MNLKHLQACAVWVVVGQMNCIAMSEACSIEQLAVMVEGCRAPEDFVAAVTVDVGYREVMVAIAIHGLATAAAGCCARGVSRGLSISIGNGVF